MSVHWRFLRLHLKAFITSNMVWIPFLWMSPYILLVLFCKVVGYISIYLVTRPLNSRYDYYFKNQGYSITGLFLTIALTDFLAFIILFIPLRLIF